MLICLLLFIFSQRTELAAQSKFTDGILPGGPLDIQGTYKLHFTTFQLLATERGYQECRPSIAGLVLHPLTSAGGTCRMSSRTKYFRFECRTLIQLARKSYAGLWTLIIGLPARPFSLPPWNGPLLVRFLLTQLIRYWISPKSSSTLWWR